MDRRVSAAWKRSQDRPLENVPEINLWKRPLKNSSRFQIAILI